MELNFTYLDGNTGGSGGGGGTSSPISNIPQSRTLSFTITSSPNGGAILIDGVNSGYTTPHTLIYSETELLVPKRISITNGSRNSTETYIISSELVTNTVSGGGVVSGGGGATYGGGYGGAPIFNAGDPNNNLTYLGNSINENFR